MKLIRIFTIIIVAIFFTSCLSIIVNTKYRLEGIYDDKAKIKKIKYDKKDILFIPIHHIGTEEFYQDLSKQIKALKNKGYFIHYEGVLPSNLDSLSLDSINRKFRKVTGLYLKKNGYLEQIEEIQKKYGIKLRKTLVNQPNSRAFYGYDSLNSYNNDVSKVELINYYEEKYDKIVLDTCDNNPLDEKYKCVIDEPEDYKEKVNDLLFNFRNNQLVNKVLIDKHEKIVIVYGGGHYEAISKIFKELN